MGSSHGSYCEGCGRRKLSAAEVCTNPICVRDPRSRQEVSGSLEHERLADACRDLLVAVMADEGVPFVDLPTAIEAMTAVVKKQRRGIAAAMIGDLREAILKVGRVP
jgi:hypothetical protein